MMRECPDSFEGFWNGWYRQLRTYAREFEGLADADRDEAVADILQKAWDRRAGYRPGFAWSTWVYRIARNHLVDVQRRCLRQARRLVHLGKALGEGEAEPADGRGVYRPDQAFLKAEALQAVRRAVAGLDQMDRELLFLTYHEELSSTDIARITGMAEGSVRSRLSRARTRLRPLLEGLP